MMPSIRHCLLLALLTVPATADDAVQDKVYEAFARRVARQLAEGKSWLFNRQLDKRGIIERGRLALPRTRRVDAAVEALRWRLEVGRKISTSIEGGGSYRFLRLLPGNPGQRHALFRWIGTDGWTYHRLRLKRGDGPGDDPKIADIYDHRRATWLAHTVRRALLPLATDAGPAALKLLPQAERQWLDLTKQRTSIARRFADGQYSSAMTIYSGLPRAVQRDRALMLPRVEAALQADPADLAEALTDYRKHHTGDIGADLMLLDHQLSGDSAKAKADAAKATIDRIERAIGADAWLDLRRAEAELAAGRLDAAKARAERALAREKDLQQIHWALLDIAMRRKDFAGVASRMILLEARFGARFSGFERKPYYADFVRSPAYKTWVDRPKKK